MIAFPVALDRRPERQDQDSGKKNRDSGRQDPGSEMEDPGSGKRDPGSERADPGSERTDPGLDRPDRDSPGQDSIGPDPIEALGDEIARLSAHINAATHQLLVLIRAFDEGEGWAWGFRSCAEWLSWRTGISPGPAREKVRVARALGDLPLISEAMARGALSFSKVRALTRVAKPETEGDLLELARHATAAHLERIVRGWKLVDRLEEAEGAAAEEAQRHAGRFLRLHPDHDGSWTIRGRLDPEVGALLEKALEWAREALYQREPAAGPDAVPAESETVELETSLEQRLADALGLVAERALAADGSEGQRGPVSRAERFQVMVHVEAAEGGTGERKASSEGGVSAGTPQGHVPVGMPADHVSEGTSEDRAPSSTPLSSRVPPAQAATSFIPETARRIACDSDLVVMTHDSKGQVLDVGRKRRTIPPAIRRALDHRDGGCRFPGCSCRYADAHHIVHWAHGGETKLENLVLVCRRHHRAVHEEGFRVELVDGSEELGFRFYRPDGRPFPAVPQAPPVPADARADLVRGNRSRGVDPDAWTATPIWQGEVLDLSLAIDMLRGLEGAARGGEGRGASELSAPWDS